MKPVILYAMLCIGIVGTCVLMADVYELGLTGECKWCVLLPSDTTWRGK